MSKTKNAKRKVFSIFRIHVKKSKSTIQIQPSLVLHFLPLQFLVQAGNQVESLIFTLSRIHLSDIWQICQISSNYQILVAKSFTLVSLISYESKLIPYCRIINPTKFWGLNSLNLQEIASEYFKICILFHIFKVGWSSLETLVSWLIN